jgi:hypothetical protein
MGADALHKNCGTFLANQKDMQQLRLRYFFLFTFSELS